MLSGRRAIDKNRPSGEHNLVEWAKPYLINKRRIFRVMDPRLEGQFSLIQAQRAATLALQCLATEARYRPEMDEVVKVLGQLQESGNISNYSQKEHLRRRQIHSNRQKTTYRRPSALPLHG